MRFFYTDSFFISPTVSPSCTISVADFPLLFLIHVGTLLQKVETGSHFRSCESHLPSIISISIHIFEAARTPPNMETENQIYRWTHCFRKFAATFTDCVNDPSDLWPLSCTSETKCQEKCSVIRGGWWSVTCISRRAKRLLYFSRFYAYTVELTSEISNFMMLHSEAPQHSTPPPPTLQIEKMAVRKKLYYYYYKKFLKYSSVLFCWNPRNKKRPEVCFFDYFVALKTPWTFINDWRKK